MVNQDLIKFFSEIETLKRLNHEGLKLAGMKNPSTLADHVCLSAQISFILAELEGADSYKCAVINLFHDNHECRIGDHNKVSSRYIDTHEAEKQVEEEQFGLLGDNVSTKILNLLDQKHQRNTKEGIIAQDADWLESAIEAKIALELGYKGASIWLDNVEKALETVSAKKILQLIREEEDFINCWWTKIQKMTYSKL